MNYTSSLIEYTFFHIKNIIQDSMSFNMNENVYHNQMIVLFLIQYIHELLNVLVLRNCEAILTRTFVKDVRQNILNFT